MLPAAAFAAANGGGVEDGPWHLIPEVPAERCLAGWFNGEVVRGRQLIAAVPLWRSRAVFSFCDGNWNLVDYTRNPSVDYHLGAVSEVLVSYEMEAGYWDMKELGDLPDEHVTLATRERREILRQVEARDSFVLASAAVQGQEVHDVAELFSPPRIVPVARSRGLRAEHSFDRETGYDLSTAKGKRRADEILDEVRPRVLISSPPCSMFSSLQNLTKGKGCPWARAKKKKEAEGLLDYAMACQEKQLSRGGDSLHEHPATATSWSRPSVRRWIQHSRVRTVMSHMCRFRLRIRKNLVKKPTRWATSMGAVYYRLDKRCRCFRNRHTQLLGGGIAAVAQRYSDRLCSEIVDGVIQHLWEKDRLEEDSLPPEEVLHHLAEGLRPPTLEAVEKHREITVERKVLKFQLPETGIDRSTLRSTAVLTEDGRWIYIERFVRVWDLAEPAAKFDHAQRAVVTIFSDDLASLIGASGGVYLTTKEKQEVMRAHCNAGHPEARDLVRLLRHAGARQEVLKYVVDEFQCDGCASRQRPKARMPAALPRCYDFNVVCGADLLEVAGISERREDLLVILNIICWGTSFNVFYPTRHSRRSAFEVWRAFVLGWLRVFGPMQILMVDGGGEFTGENFARSAERWGILLEVSDADAPWERGKTERAGGIFKDIYYKAREMAQPQSHEECKLLVHECAWAKATMSNRSGYSPAQRVFGKNPVLNLDLTGDGIFDYQLSQEDGDDASFERAAALRKAARTAMIEVDARARLSRAHRARPRKEEEFQPEDVVKVFRRGVVGKKRDRWVGPGVVIAVRGEHHWVSMRGELWRCARVQLRKCTREEKQGFELAAPILLRHRDRLRHDPEKQGYVDVQAEGSDENLHGGGEGQPPAAEGEQPEEEDRPADPEDEEAPAEGQGSQDQEADDEPPGAADRPSAEDVSEDHGPLAPATPPNAEGAAAPENAEIPESAEVPMGPEAKEETPPTSRKREPEVSAEELSKQSLGDAPTSSGEARHGSGGASSSSAGALAPRATMADPQVDHQEVPPEAEQVTEDLQRDLAASLGPEGNRVLSRLQRKRAFEESDGARQLRRRTYGVWSADVNGKRKFPVLVFPGDQGYEKLSTGDNWVMLNFSESRVYAAGRGGELKEKDFTPEQRKRFEAAKKAELDGVIELGAIRLLSKAEADQVAREKKHRILPSRFVLTEKRMELGQDTKAKARWCVLGNKDQEAYSVERFSPTPATSTLMLTLVLIASQKFTLIIMDVKMAFMQSDHRQREGGELYARLPPGGVQGYPQGGVVELLTAVYGLVDGPIVWRLTLRRLVLELGYKESSFDPCLYFLPATAADRRELGLVNVGVAGVILTDVDDLLQGGGSRHQQLMGELQSKLRFGKCNTGGGEYLGRTLRQRDDYAVEVSFERYINERLSPIRLSPARRAQKDSQLTEKETTLLKAAGGACLWVGKEGRPDCAAAAAMVCIKMHPDKEYHVSDILAANKLIGELKGTAAASILLRPLPLEEIVWAVVSDASSINLPDGRSQGGFSVALTTRPFLDGKVVDFDLVRWCSRRVRRCVRASLGSEALALDDGLAEAEWLRATWAEMVDPSVCLRDETLYGNGETAVVVRHVGPVDLDPPTAMVTDAKGLFDHLSRPSATAGAHERRTLVDIKVMAHSIRLLKGIVKWVPAEIMISDPLTKRTGNGALMRHVMSTARFGVSQAAMREILEGLGTPLQKDRAGKKMLKHQARLSPGVGDGGPGGAQRSSGARL